jgi:hypothetical protein
LSQWPKKVDGNTALDGFYRIVRIDVTPLLSKKDCQSTAKPILAVH